MLRPVGASSPPPPPHSPKKEEKLTNQRSEDAAELKSDSSGAVVKGQHWACPVLFIFFTASLSEVIHQRDCDCHKRAANTQLLDDAAPCNVTLAFNRLNSSISSVETWVLCSSTS